MLVIIFSVSSILIGVAFSARKNAVMTYQWFGEAINFAAQAANRDGDLSLASSRTSDARQWFGYSFSRMTGTTFSGYSFKPGGQSIYPGPIRLISFTYTPPGHPVPGGGTAKQPGYTAVIKVPVVGGNFPFIGPQYVAVPMKCFGVIKSQVVRS